MRRGPSRAFRELLDDQRAGWNSVSGATRAEDAKVVYAAALDHPGALREKGEGFGDSSGALWGLGTVVVWLVVEPVW